MPAIALLLQLALTAGPQAVPAAQTSAPGVDEALIRELVQQYFDAESRKDADAALGFWSASASPRPAREGFVALFAAGDVQYTATIRAVTIAGSEARVRVSVARVRAAAADGTAAATPLPPLEIAQVWRQEGATWKLLRDEPAADLVDILLAAAPADRARLMDENPADVTPAVRYVLAQRASTLAGTYQYAKAGEIFDLVLRASRKLGDRRGESEALQNIANAHYFLKEFQEANDYFQQRLTLAREMDDEEAIAAATLGLATVAYSQGEYTPALAHYLEALALYEKRDEGASAGRTLVSVGNVQFLSADYDAATTSYTRALALLVAGMDPPGAAYARSGLARVYAAQGDIAAALDTYGQVLADARARAVIDPRSGAEVAAALESIGELQFRLGNSDQARGSFDEARRLSDSTPDAAARLLGELGLTELVAGRFDAALADYTDSRTRYEQAKSPEGVAHAWVGIGFSQAGRQKYVDAITAYRTAIGLFDEQKRDEDTARAWLGLSLAQSGGANDAAALESANTVRAIADRIASPDLTWRAAVRAGDALGKLARLDEARRAFEDAITAIDRLAADLAIDADARGQLADSGSAWAGLAFTLAKQGDAAGALAAAEARRAHSRRLQLAPFERDIVRGETPDEQAAEQGIVRDLLSARAQLRAERTAPRPDPSRVTKLAGQVTDLQARRADQHARLFARLPELERWRGAPAPSTPLGTGALAKVAAIDALVTDARALAVEYVVSDEEVLVLSVAHGETGPDVTATIVPSSRHVLADAIAQAMQPASLRDAAEWRKRAAPLTAALVTPIASRLAGRDRCIVVPDDLLWKVPFEALPEEGGPLAARMRVTYATSLATLEVQRALPAAAASAPVTAGIIAAPVIPARIQAQLALIRSGWKEPDAASSLASARAIADVYASAAAVAAVATASVPSAATAPTTPPAQTSLTGVDATEAAGRVLLETTDVLHIGAPLEMSGPTPLFSSVLLGGSGDAPQNDGRWEAREWFTANGRARVMVIPDATTFGAPGAGGAMDVVAWAAAAAGVSSLVLGRWPADGFTPDAVVLALHAQLAKGLPASEALAAAMAAVREKSGDAPAVWAGLRLVGGSR